MLAEHVTRIARGNPGVIAIVGPTAVGKTAAAVELAGSIGAEIVSADSMAVYRGMDIGTAKPNARERSAAVFHLVDVADPARPFSVAQYQRLAHRAIDGILARGRSALVVGGSGLYVRAAIDGLNASVPAADDRLRQELREQAREHGSAWVHARLAAVDPESARLIHPNNLKRTIRALEIYESTGRPASAVFAADANRPPRYDGARWFGLTIDRAVLFDRIDRRVDLMIDAGLVDEVSGLLESGAGAGLTSMQGLGYREVAGYLRGKYGLDEAIALLKKNTRRLARRQYTWFRANPRVEWIDVDGLDAEEVSQIIKERIDQ